MYLIWRSISNDNDSFWCIKKEYIYIFLSCVNGFSSLATVFFLLPRWSIIMEAQFFFFSFTVQLHIGFNVTFIARWCIPHNSVQSSYIISTRWMSFFSFRMWNMAKSIFVVANHLIWNWLIIYALRRKKRLKSIDWFIIANAMCSFDLIFNWMQCNAGGGPIDD